MRPATRGPALPLAALAMLVLALLSASARSAEIAPEQLALLKTFRGEFVDITPGKAPFPSPFAIGRDGGPPAEAPRHEVALRPFAIARYEVTQDLWTSVMGKNPSRWQGPRNSVETLTWDEAVDFCSRVTERLRAAKLIGPDQTVRLPSEAEWEYAARAGTNTRYSFGDDVASLDAHAWSTRNAAGNDPAVGVLKPNAWNLCDVHGYLWEWCADTWHDNHQDAPADGAPRQGSVTEPRRVLRGGSWKDPAELLTSSHRRPAPRTLKDDAVGLRCVLDTPAP